MITDISLFAGSALDGSHDFLFGVIFHHDSESHAAEQNLTKKVKTKLVREQNPVGFLKPFLQYNQFVCSGKIE